MAAQSPALAEAVHRIFDARIKRRSFVGLPPALRPQGLEAAYDAQDLIKDALVEAGAGPVVGYKLGCTAPVMQRELNIHHPCSGYMYRSGMFRDGAVIQSADYVRPGVECEIAVTLAKPLHTSYAPFDRAAIEDAVGSVHAAIELVDERYDDWSAVGAETLIADDFFHAGLVLGQPIYDWRRLDLASVKGVARANGKVTGGGRGADIMGHPLAALEWLTNHCAQRGKDIFAGSVISLGSVTGAYWLTPGETIEVEFGGLGPAVKLSYR